jgi:spermidine/putrescine transport system ATP-binding protein
MQGASVELRAIGKSFDGHPAVVDVTLAVERGEFFSLLGPSGCGKTTLLRLIAGFDIPSCGEILRAGDRPTSEAPPAQSRVSALRPVPPHDCLQERGLWLGDAEAAPGRD